MKILYTHRTQGVGAEGAHIKGIYEAFRGMGHAMEMVCLPGCNPSEGGAAPAPGAGSPPGPSRKRWLGKVYRLIADHVPQILFECVEMAYNAVLFARLSLRCLARRPDLIYERYSLNTFAGSAVAGLFGIKHALEVNDSVVIERSRPLVLRAVSGLIEGWCLRRAALVITITDRFAGRLRGRFGDGFRIEVMTNGVARDRFDRAFDREASRARFGLAESIVLGGAGQFLPWHGLQELVEHIGPLAEARDLRFLFIGDGPARGAVEAAAERLGIAGRVRFTGMLPIDSVPDCLAALDFAIVPAAAPHASPMKLIEYMAMGLPIVAPDLPSIRAALRDGSMGRIFPAGDWPAMRSALVALLDDRDAAASMGARARAHVFAELTWDRHARRTLNLLGLG